MASHLAGKLDLASLLDLERKMSLEAGIIWAILVGIYLGLALAIAGWLGVVAAIVFAVVVWVIVVNA